MKDRLYSIVACVLAFVMSVLLFCTAAFGSPDGYFDAACELMQTDTGKTLGMLFGSLFLFSLGVSCLCDAIFYRKKADQKD